MPFRDALACLRAPLTLRDDERRIFGEFARKYLRSGQTVYDIGCGDKPFKPIIDSIGSRYIGIDIEAGFYDPGHIDLVGNAYDIPVGSGEADAVLSSQVIEHLEYPEKAISEVARVLKTDGVFILVFPFFYPLHAVPHDYLRYFEFFMRSCLERNGFEVMEMQRIGGFWYCAGMMAGYYLQNFDRGVVKKLRLVPFIVWLVKWFLFMAHVAEGFALKSAKQNPDEIRALWTVNYVYAACKRH